MCTDNQSAFLARKRFASIVGRTPYDFQDTPPGNRPLRRFEDFESAGRFSYQLKQRLVRRPFAFFFGGEEEQVNFFRILAGLIGGGLNEPY